MKRKITLIYLVFGIASVVLVGFVLYYSLSNVLVNESIMSTETAVNQSGKYLEIYIEKLKGISDSLRTNQDVIEYFGENMVFEPKIYEERIHRLIDNLMESDTSLQSVILISKDGKLFSNEKNLDMSMSEDMMEESWYIEAMHNAMPTLTSARMQKFSMDKDLWVISLSQEIVDATGANIGVAVIDVPYTALETYLMDLHLGEDGFVYILNANQDVVFHQDQRYYEDEERRKALVELMENTSNYQTKTEILINQYKMANTDWTLVAVSSLDALLVLRRQVLETVVIGISIIFVVVIVTSMILKGLTKEIQQREQEIYQHEMRAMYSQINPHFLYNTLDAIVWMAEFNKKEDVIAITKSLARFFRLSLNQGKAVTTLRDEIEHVQQYLYIQKQRYQDKLEYSVHADEEALDVLVPKIILQPIVENSIYHGIKDKDGIGTIDITIKSYNDYIQILISDDGIGYDEQIEETEKDKSHKTKLGGIGLQNVERRIQLFCGQDYGLSIHSKKNIGTTVTLKICKGRS